MEIQRITFNKGTTTWGAGRPLKNGLTTSQVREELKKSGSGSVVVEFNTLEQFIEKDKERFTKRINSIVKDTNYTVVGDWANRVEDGIVFDCHFQVVIEKKN